MSRQVPNLFPSIPTEPRIALVGEAPGADETLQGVPFVGASGKLLTEVLRNAGIIKGSCFIGNVYQWQPPGNKIKLVNHYSPEWIKSVALLKEDLIRFQPDIIVALGATALEVLTGKKGITLWRGSILPCTLVDGFKVLPTLHPAAIFRQYKFKPVLQLDINRVLEEAKIKGLGLMHRNYIINPSFSDVMDHLKAYRNCDKLSMDFETMGDRAFPTCLGMAHSKDYAICIPLDERWTSEQAAQIWLGIQEVMHGTSRKIFHNATFDLSVFLLHTGLVCRGLYMDTMLAHHACYPELPKTLAFCASIYTREPYYKDERKESEEEDEKSWKGGSVDKNKLWVYNCKDCCVTYEVSEALEKEMAELGVRRAFEMEQSYLELALYMTFKGMKIDEKKMDARYFEFERAIKNQSKALGIICGQDINVKSPKAMKELLYEKWGMPKIYNVTDGRRVLTANADALIKLARKTGDPRLLLMLKHRQTRTQQAFYQLETVKGRIHGGFRVYGTEAGRWSCRDSILGGRNVMNIPKERRDIYVADDGMILVGVDKAQAEARFVAYKSFLVTGDPSYMHLVESGQKIHVWFGKKLIDFGVFKIAPEELTSDSDEYYISKKSIHSFSYKLHPKTFVDVVARETDGKIIIPVHMAHEIQEAMFTALPAVPLWQEAIVKHLAGGNLRMVNCFGWARVFFDRWGDDLFREACSWEPQSTVGIDVSESIKRCFYGIKELQILQQNYDSLLGQCPKEMGLDVAKQMVKHFTHPLIISSFKLDKTIQFTIPVEACIGENWYEMEELKKEQLV